MTSRGRAQGVANVCQRVLPTPTATDRPISTQRPVVRVSRRLASHQAPQAAALRSAINAARATASGDLSKLGGARADLAKVSGQAAAPGGHGDAESPVGIAHAHGVAGGIRRRAHG